MKKNKRDKLTSGEKVLLIDILKKAALMAGSVLLKYYQKDLVIAYKNSSHKMLVTKADTEAQKIVFDVIVKEMALRGFEKDDVGFIGEENLSKPGLHTFVIDPLDGTTNFASGLPYFATSIGYFYKGVLQSGVIYVPVFNEMFYAELGKGSHYQNGNRLKIAYQPLNKSLINGYLNSAAKIHNRQLEIYQNFLPQIRSLRNIGSIAVELSYTAKNIFNLSINGHACIWDIAAGCIIVSEAGGQMVDWQGKPIVPRLTQVDYQTITGHPKAVKDIIRYFSLPPANKVG